MRDPKEKKGAHDAIETVSFPWGSERMPEEIRLHILSFVPRVRHLAQFALTSRASAALTKDKSLKLYKLNWRRYTIPNAKEPESYEKAFKQLFSSLSPDERKLIHAAVTDDNETLKRYINDPALRNRFRDRLLIIATRKGDLNLLQSLDCSFDDLNRLALASFSAHAQNRQVMLDYFWELVDAFFSPQNEAQTRALFEHNHFANNTTTHWAAILNRPEALKKNFHNKPNRFGVTPLGLAEHYKHIQCIKVFKDRAVEETIELTQERLDNALPEAVRHAQLDSVLVLLARGAKPNAVFKSEYRALVQATVKSKLAICLLLACGAEPNLMGWEGNIALVSAVRGGFLRGKRDHIEAVRVLLSYAAKPDTAEADGSTALMEAARLGHTDILQLLLEYDAALDLKDRSGMSALMGAAINNQPAALHLLLKHGANSELKEKTDPYVYTAETKSKAACLIDVVKFLMTEEQQEIKNSAGGLWNKHVSKPSLLEQAYTNNPQYFKRIIGEITAGHESWSWVTKEMKERFLNDPVVKPFCPSKSTSTPMLG